MDYDELPEDGNLSSRISVEIANYSGGESSLGEAMKTAKTKSNTQQEKRNASILGNAFNFNNSDGSNKFVELTSDYIPIQEAMLLLFRIQRRQVLSDGRRFLFMFVFFLACTFMIHEPHTSWEQTSSIMDIFLDEEFPDANVYKNFFDVATHEEVWEYTQQVLVPGLFSDRVWYSGREYSDDEMGYTMHEHKIIGGLRIRVNKMSPFECSTKHINAPEGNICYSSFDQDDQDKQATFGDPATIGNGTFNIVVPGYIQLESGSDIAGCSRDVLQFLNGTNPNLPISPQNPAEIAIWYEDVDGAFHTILVDVIGNVTINEFQDAHENTNGFEYTLVFGSVWEQETTSAAVGFAHGKYQFYDDIGKVKGRYGYGDYGSGTNYGTGGFSVALDPKLPRSAAASIFEKARRDRLTDSSTRLLMFEFNLYNYNTELLTTVRLKFEHMETTKFLPSHEISTYRLWVYSKPVDTIRFLIECILLISLGYNLLYEIWIFLEYGFHGYFVNAEMRNVLSIGFIALNLVTLVYWVLYLFEDDAAVIRENTVEDNAYTDGTKFISGHLAGYYWEHAFMWAGFVTIASCVQFFRVASLNRRGLVMWKTFTRSLQDIVIYAVVLFAFLLAFACASMWIFGSEIDDFHDIWSSLSSVTRWSLGEFNYYEMSLTSPKAAGPVFYLYTFIVFLFFMNIIVAVLVEAYETTTEEMEEDKTWLSQLPSLTFELGYDVRNFVKQTILNAVRMVTCSKGEDLDGDGVTDVVNAGCLKRLRVSTDWERESKLFTTMAEAYRKAKITRPPIDLFEYMLSSYQTMKREDMNRDRAKGIYHADNRTTKTYFVGKKEFRALVGDIKVADAVFVAYSKLKTVTLVNAAESRVHLAPPDLAQPEDDTIEDPPKQSISDAKGTFEVMKVNRHGNSQYRRVLFDVESFELRSYNTRWHLRRVFHMRDLTQIERSVIDPNRIKLIFSNESTGVLNLRFKTEELREDFEQLAKSIAKMALDSL